MTDQHKRITHLINKLATMDVVSHKDLCPKLRLTALDEVTSLLLEHRVVVGDGDELVITEALGIGDVRKVGVASFTEFTNDQRFVELQRNVRQDEQTASWVLTLFSLRNDSGLLLLSM